MNWARSLIFWLTAISCAAQNSADTEQWAREAKAAIEREDWAAAIDRYQRIVEAMPRMAEAHTNLGIARYLDAQFDEALASFDRARRLSPGLFAPWLFLGMTHARRRDYARAIPLLEQALAKQPSNPQALLYLGVSRTASGRADLGERHLEKLVSLDPSDSEALYQLGKTYLIRSTASFERVHRLDPGGFLHLRILLRIDEAEGKPPDALEARRREIEAAKPGYPGLRQKPACPAPAPSAGASDWQLERYVSCAIAQHKVDEAKRFLHQSLAAAPRSVLIHFLLGDVYLQKSLQAHERLYAIDPTGHRTLMLEAETMEARHKPAEALELYNRIATIAPKASEVFYRIGVLLVEQRQLDEAVRAFERALRADPYDALARVRLGEVLVYRQQQERAIPLLEEAIRQDATIPAAHSALGRARLLQGDATGAAAALETAVRLEPGDRQAHYQLARAYRSLGRHDDAARALAVFRRLSRQRTLPVKTPLLEAAEPER